ncbi:MAG TPA: peptide chain release factor N(5)-glutamine methyltransferase [Terriglobales bacterium]|nr:peptide chain release factor N(5)-glutamine methyltransferase [Terriglobales bacterium]
MPTLRQLLVQAAAALERAGVAEPRLTAAVLLAHRLGRDRAYLYAHSEAELPAEEQAAWERLIARRAAGAPLQYLTGEQEFYGRRFQVSPAVLIPRPETELVVEAALERLPPDAPARIVDVGTGSGCIAVTLALERPQAEVVATDRSSAALAVARANAAALGARVAFVETDLLAGLAGPFDLIVSNPPYVAEAELATLQPEVREHEPRAALVAGPLGTEIYARLIPQAQAALRPGGWLVLELGYESAAAVRELLGAGWGEVETRRDLQGWERVLVAQVIGA